MPARYRARARRLARRRRARAAPSKFPFTDAMTHFARALGAARSGDAAAAEKDVERARASPRRAQGREERLLGDRGRGQPPRRGGLDRARRRARPTKRSRLMRTRRRHRGQEREAHRHARAASCPRASCSGEMLLELKRPAEALKEFEASQLREPDRFRGYYGAAQAAAQSGDRRRRSSYLRSWWASPARAPAAGAVQARTFLAANP